MKSINVTFAVISLLFAGQVQAQGMVTDTDGDGAFSLQELQAAFPAVTERNFIAADTNGNGSVDMKELAAAVETGKIPT
jgi:hypothetical protein